MIFGLVFKIVSIISNIFVLLIILLLAFAYIKLKPIYTKIRDGDTKFIEKYIEKLNLQQIISGLLTKIDLNDIILKNIKIDDMLKKLLTDEMIETIIKDKLKDGELINRLIQEKIRGGG